MSDMHLSDEAIAAQADGVLTGLARDRAVKHLDGCAECRTAVRVQREAALALRAAGAPAVPTHLVERLRTVPLTTPLPAPPPASIAQDGSPLLATFAPMAGLVPARTERGRRVPPMITAAAAVALAGALGGVAVAATNSSGGTGGQHVGPAVVRHVNWVHVQR